MARRTCLILTHGAGSDRNAPILVRLDQAFTKAGFTVERLNLPYRIERPSGPPPRGSAAADRAGLSEAVDRARAKGFERVFLGGHSYGGRQASMLAAERPDVADGLLLLAYPLRPPRSKTAPDRTSHLSGIKVPVLFVHGTRDPFGSPEELAQAVALISSATDLMVVEKAGHELAGVDGAGVVQRFNALMGSDPDTPASV